MSSGPHGEPSKALPHLRRGHADDRARCVATRVVLRSKKAVGVSLRHGGSTRRQFRAAVTTHIVLSWKKLWAVCLATTNSTWRTISYAFVLYRELVTELSHPSSTTSLPTESL